MPFIQRPSLYRHIENWNIDSADSRQPRKLVSGPVLVQRPADINDCLTQPELYVSQSAFMRTRNYDPLPAEVRSQLTRELVASLNSHDLDWEGALSGYFKESKWVTTQSWGIRFVRGLHAGALAPQDSDDIQALIDRFVTRKTIGDDIAGGWNRLRPRPRDALHEAMGAALMRLSDSQQTVAHSVAYLDFPLTRIERGELFCRLVQSTVAFTGSALEFATYTAAADDRMATAFREGHAEPEILELQRLYPTAWRLSRVAATDHEIGAGYEVGSGDEIILSTASAHRDPDYWADAGQHCPERWDDESQARTKAFMPFGRGPSSCPGRSIAMSTLQTALHRLFRDYTVSRMGWMLARRRPYVRAVLAAPFCWARFDPR